MATSRRFLRLFSMLAMIGIPIVIIMPNKYINTYVKNTTYPHLNLRGGVSSNLNESNQNVEVPDNSRQKRLPQVIIIGIMKCGTYALNTMMELHPKVVSASYKFERELDFFNRNYERGLEWYRNEMPYSRIDQITIEKSPKYTQILNTEVPLRIHSMNSSIRLILIVKDPVTRTIGHYTHMKSHNKEKDRYLLSFGNYSLRPDGEVNYDHPIIAYSLYERYLKFYLEVFSREQILVVDGDKLIQDPLPILNKVERYLNLDTYITKDKFYYNEKKGFYCLKKKKIGCFKKTKGREHPDVDEDILRKLRVFFAPYNRKFYDLVGHDFGW